MAESSESDNALVLGQFQAADSTQPASAQIFPYTLTLAVPSNVPVMVNYETVADTTGTNPATAGTDYTPVSGSVTFAPGETQQEIDIPLLNSNGTGLDKTFLLLLQAALIPAGCSRTPGRLRRWPLAFLRKRVLRKRTKGDNQRHLSFFRIHPLPWFPAPPNLPLFNSQIHSRR